MKRTIATLLGSALIAASLVGNAQAQHRGGGFRGGFHGGFHGGFRGRFHGGFRGFRGRFFVGPSFYDPFWYAPFWDYYYPYYYPYYGAAYSYYPYYYPPDYGAYPQQPSAAEPSQSRDWYYCNDPRGYYPSVRSCNTQWQAVPAAPPPS